MNYHAWRRRTKSAATPGQGRPNATETPNRRWLTRLFASGLTASLLVLLVLKGFFLFGGPLPKHSRIPAQPLGIVLVRGILAPRFKLVRGSSEDFGSWCLHGLNVGEQQNSAAAGH
jgi:hypothetical protein